MSPRIQIDEDVFEALKEQAIPFQDHEPNDVLRRLLIERSEHEGSAGTLEIARPARSKGDGSRDRRAGRHSENSKPAKRRRAASNTLMPETEYQYPILRTLLDNGGRMPTREVVAAVGELLEDKLLPADRETLGRKPRWEGRVQFTRLQLIKDGLMKKGSPRGVWEITPQGEKAVTNLSGDKVEMTKHPSPASAGVLR